MNRPVDYVWFSCFSFGTFRLFLFFCPEMYNWTYMFLPLLYCRVNVCYSSLTFSRLWSSWGWSSCLIHLCLLRLQLDTLQQWLLHKWVMNEWMNEWLSLSIQWGITRYTQVANPKRQRHSLFHHLLTLDVICGCLLFWARERRPELPKHGCVMSP